MTAFNAKLNKTQLIAAGIKAEKELAALRALAAKPAATKTIVQTVTSPAVKALDIEALTTSLQALQSDVGDAIGSYQTNLTAEMSEVLDLRNQLEAELGELLELHEIVPDGSSTLGMLINQIEETQTTSAKQISLRAQEIEDSCLEDAENWEAEQDLHDRAFAKSTSDRRQAVSREVDEYKYLREKVRAQDDQIDAEKERSFSQEMNEIKRVASVQIAERDNELVIRENSHASICTQEVDLNAELSSALKKAEAEGTAIANKQVAHAVDMVEAENSAEVNSQLIERGALLAEQADNAESILRLTTRLEQLTNSNQQLAHDALEARHKGSTQALEAVERIALASASAKK